MESYRDGNSIQASEINEIRRLVTNRNVKTLLEIGTYRGNVAFSLYDLVVEEHEGSITSVDIKQQNEYNKLNKLYIEEHEMKNIHLSLAGSNRFFVKNNKTFDMVILDGEQSYDQVKNDLKNALDVLTENGIVLVYRYRNSVPAQRVINELDGSKYNKVLIHTVRHLMTISKKEIVRELPKVEISKPMDDDSITMKEIKNDKITSEEKKDDGLVRSSYNRIE